MTLNKFYLTENECYKVGRKHTVKGIMVHSTGCNNPNVAMYLNYWNQLRPGGRQVCVHAFIGKLFGNEVGTAVKARTGMPTSWGTSDLKYARMT